MDARRRRRLLVYCADAEMAEHLAWLLELRARRWDGSRMVWTLAASSAQGVREAAAAALIDCLVICRMPGAEKTDAYVAALLKDGHIGEALVLLENRCGVDGFEFASRIVRGTIRIVMAEFLEAVRIAIARKRGPKKRELLPPGSVPAMEARA